jgi:hypothetical protein
MAEPLPPGRPPTDLSAAIAWIEQPDGTRLKVSIADRIVEIVGAGLFLHDAAAAIGFPIDTLRSWRRTGARAARQLLNGEKRLSDLSAHEQQCGELSIRWDRAEMEARRSLMDVSWKVATGGLTRTEVTRKVVHPENVDPSAVRTIETTTKTIEVLPSDRMLSWLLEHRWPEDFGRRRLEITGDGGGPVQVEDATAAVDKLRSAIADIREAKAENDPTAGNGTHV